MRPRLGLLCISFCLPALLNAQTPPSSMREVQLRREVDSLRVLVDSLRKAVPAKPVTKSRANSSADEATIFTAGKWSVSRSLDKMTDKPSCTGIYEDDWKTQLSGSGFYINYRGRGGVKAVTLRFGEEPALPLRSATAAERSISAVIIRGEDFDTLLHSSRLRAQVFTVLDHIVVEDVDLSDIGGAYKVITDDPRCR
jgi:hypothetical protein